MLYLKTAILAVFGCLLLLGISLALGGACRPLNEAMALLN